MPGNHDIDREQITEAETRWLDSSPDVEHERAPDKVNEMIRDANKLWKHFMERLSYYNEFLQTLGYEHLVTDPERLIYSHTLRVAGLEVGIAGLNSSWPCGGRDKEKGKLWLGRWQIGELYRQLKGSDFSIALIHHPSNWFTEHEDPDLERELEKMFQFHLHGEHKEWVKELDGHVRIAARACYDSSRKENGYNFVRLLPMQNRGEVFLRRYDKDGGGWIPRIVYGKTHDEGKWPLSRALS